MKLFQFEEQDTSWIILVFRGRFSMPFPPLKEKWDISCKNNTEEIPLMVHITIQKSPIPIVERNVQLFFLYAKSVQLRL